MRCHRPADYPSGVDVEHKSEVQEAFVCWEVGDVRRPQAVRRGGTEVPLHEIWSRNGTRIAAGGPPLPAAHATSQAGSAHQPSYSPAAAAYPESAQLGVHPQEVSVSLPAPLVELADLVREGGVLAAPLRGWSALRGIVAALRDTDHPAQQRNGKMRLLRVDEPQKAHRPPISSLAKKAAAFRRISRS
jgi:hypothetical protein